MGKTKDEKRHQSRTEEQKKKTKTKAEASKKQQKLDTTDRLTRVESETTWDVSQLAEFFLFFCCFWLLCVYLVLPCCFDWSNPRSTGRPTYKIYHWKKAVRRWSLQPIKLASWQKISTPTLTT